MDREPPDARASAAEDTSGSPLAQAALRGAAGVVVGRGLGASGAGSLILGLLSAVTALTPRAGVDRRRVAGAADENDPADHASDVGNDAPGRTSDGGSGASAGAADGELNDRGTEAGPLRPTERAPALLEPFEAFLDDFDTDQENAGREQWTEAHAMKPPDASGPQRDEIPMWREAGDGTDADGGMHAHNSTVGGLGESDPGTDGFLGAAAYPPGAIDSDATTGDRHDDVEAATPGDWRDFVEWPAASSGPGISALTAETISALDSFNAEPFDSIPFQARDEEITAPKNSGAEGAGWTRSHSTPEVPPSGVSPIVFDDIGNELRTFDAAPTASLPAPVPTAAAPVPSELTPDEIWEMAARLATVPDAGSVVDATVVPTPDRQPVSPSGVTSAGEWSTPAPAPIGVGPSASAIPADPVAHPTPAPSIPSTQGPGLEESEFISAAADPPLPTHVISAAKIAGVVATRVLSEKDDEHEVEARGRAEIPAAMFARVTPRSPRASSPVVPPAIPVAIPVDPPPMPTASFAGPPQPLIASEPVVSVGAAAPPALVPPPLPPAAETLPPASATGAVPRKEARSLAKATPAPIATVPAQSAAASPPLRVPPRKVRRAQRRPSWTLMLGTAGLLCGTVGAAWYVWQDQGSMTSFENWRAAARNLPRLWQGGAEGPADSRPASTPGPTDAAAPTPSSSPSSSSPAKPSPPAASKGSEASAVDSGRVVQPVASTSSKPAAPAVAELAAAPATAKPAAPTTAMPPVPEPAEAGAAASTGVAAPADPASVSSPAVMKAETVSADEPASEPPKLAPATSSVLGEDDLLDAAPVAPPPPAAAAEGFTDSGITNAQLDPEVAKAQSAVEALITADSVDKIEPLVFDGPKLREGLINYYQSRPMRPLKGAVLEMQYAGKVPTTGARAFIFSVVHPDHPRGFPVSAESTPHGYQIDWESYIQWRDEWLRGFIENRASGPYTLFVVLRRSHYFNDDITNLDDRLVFNVASAVNGDTGSVAFVDKRSPVGRSLADTYEWGKAYFPVAELEWARDEKGHPYVRINRIVRPTWRRNPGRE